VAADPLVELEGTHKWFPLARTALEVLERAPARAIHAVDGVDLTIRAGECVGLIGESGSGKTTLGWVVARLLDATRGSIRFAGRDIGGLRRGELRRWRRNVQVVFQDPVGSLDPRLRVWQIVGEPIRAQEGPSFDLLLAPWRELAAPARRAPGRPTDSFGARVRGFPGRGRAALAQYVNAARRTRRAVLRARVAEVLPTVGLPADCLDQYPHEFSGGGRQRLSLARALSVDPRLVVLDEPTSALDVAVQAQILNRLVRLQRERHLAFLLITHNVAAVRYVADRVAVMYLGRIAEVGNVRDVLEHPIHPYTKALLAAVPVADVRRRRMRYRIGGDIPTLIDPKPGCRFAPRCPFVVERCRVEDPELRPYAGRSAHAVACHRADEVADVPPVSLLETAGADRSRGAPPAGDADVAGSDAGGPSPPSSATAS
jgi:peptide/nickel transport system ATP-binding protein